MYTIIIVFLAAFIMGIAYSFFYPELLKNVLQIFQDKFGNTPFGWKLAIAIFKQNLFVAGIVMASGILFGVLPVGVVLFNGFIFGFITSLFFRLSQLPFYMKLGFLVLTLLPHGIFELPIILFSAMLGLKFGTRWMGKQSVGQRGSVLKRDLITIVKVLPAICIVLFIAAIIEVFVSGKLGLGVFKGGV